MGNTQCKQNLKLEEAMNKASPVYSTGAASTSLLIYEGIKEMSNVY
jgi:hypothetical protein